LLVDLYMILDQSDRAVAVCLDYLRHLGVDGRPIRQKRKWAENTSGSGRGSGAARSRSSSSCL
jgi:hypothetical protein